MGGYPPRPKGYAFFAERSEGCALGFTKMYLIKDLKSIFVKPV